MTDHQAYAHLMNDEYRDEPQKAPGKQTMDHTVEGFSSGAPPKQHTCYALIVFLCCCWPLGLQALIMSRKVKNYIRRKEMFKANMASEDALWYSKMGLKIGCAFTVSMVICLVVYMVIIVSYLKKQMGPELDLSDQLGQIDFSQLQQQAGPQG